MMSAPPIPAASPVRRIALLGNPNTGKTTLFNRLCGLRSKTANFPGSTVESHVGTCACGTSELEVVDLPGTYSLQLELPESRLCTDCIEGRVPGCGPTAMLVVIDATTLQRNLPLAASVLQRSRPTVIALTMGDIAHQRGIFIDVESLSRLLGCRVVRASGRTGEGIAELTAELEEAAERGLLGETHSPVAGLPAGSTDSREVASWARRVAALVSAQEPQGRLAAQAADARADRFDALLTHPVIGLVTFLGVMALLFTAIFWLAEFPMNAIDELFRVVGGGIDDLLPNGLLQDLLRDGVVAGIAGVVVFLPQIVLLFFLLALLEDSGYLARAALAVDRVMRRFGLPGQAFVPLLSSHACALPGIMATRLIPDRRDRLAAILVAPFMSCSARVPVYVLLTALLFPDRPGAAALAFIGCYLLGALAGMTSAALARRTILRGASRPMMLELPPYRVPSIRTAALAAADRGGVFLRNAGGIILAISLVMWWLQAFPRAAPMAEDTPPDVLLRAQHEGSFAGTIGHVVEPVFAPLGFDWQISVGVMNSFLAREVFVSSMKVLVNAGPSDSDVDVGTVAAMGRATRADGAPLFTPATSLSLLVFYVLAMQCLPTLAVTKRETGSWKWPALQLGWMSLVAWMAAWAAHAIAVGAGLP